MKSVIISPAQSQLKNGNRFACLSKSDPREEKGVITTFAACRKRNYSKAKKVKKPFGIGHLAGNCLNIQIMAMYESCVKYEVPYYHLLDLSSLVGGGEDEVPDYELEHELTHSDDDLEVSKLLLVGGGEDSKDIASPPKKRRKRGKGRSRQIGKQQKSRNAGAKKEMDKTMDTENNGLTPIGNSKVGSPIKKATWRESPRGKASIAASHEKYEGSKKAQLTRQAYRASFRGVETKKTYEASSKAMQTRKSYEASSEGMETRMSYEASPGGMETRRSYEASSGGKGTRLTYESLPERRESKKRNESSEGYIATRRRYKSSQGRVESRKRYESKEEAQNTRRRYMSTEGRFVRIEYSASKVGRESHVRACKKYENREENQTRRAYNMRVKRAIEHSNARAVEKDRPTAAETEPGKSEPVEQGANADRSGKEPTNFSPLEARNSRSNKDAMAIIRSHKVSYIVTCKLEVEI